MQTMRRLIAAATVLALIAILAPHASLAGTTCSVLFDPRGDVAGPLGTPRPGARAGAAIDITDVTMTSSPRYVIVGMRVADLSARATPGAGGAFYTVFWSLGADRYFAQAGRVATSWTFTAGPATGVDDAIPQQGAPALSGGAYSEGSVVRIVVDRRQVGSPQPGATLQQIRAGSQESVWRSDPATGLPQTDSVAATTDRAGGAEGGRFLLGSICLPELSGTGERCLITADSTADATGGAVPATWADTGSGVDTRSAPVGAVDPATEITSLQMGSNEGTILVDVGLAGLDKPLPKGAEAERWDVGWVLGTQSYSAFAERREAGPVFGYVVGGKVVPTTGSIDRAGGSVRILVPRYEVGSEGTTRLTAIRAVSSLVFAGLPDRRDWAPNTPTFAAQYVTGVTCADQEKAACPVVIDQAGDATLVDSGSGSVPEEQPASDVTGAGAAAPDGVLVLSIRVADIGAPPPDGFDKQGWTVSWTFADTRSYAQAERGRDSLVFRYGALGPAKDFAAPSGPSFGGAAAEGSFDVASGVVRISVPRSGIGGPANGVMLSDFGVQSWVMSDDEVAQGAYAPARNHVKIDDTAIAPYRVGIACGA